MQNSDRKIEINASSLVELKAELLRKQAEFKKLRQSSAESNTIRATAATEKSNIWSKKNKVVLERAQHDIEEKCEEEDILSKSKKALESKSKIYDELAQPQTNLTEEDGSGLFLVDFQKKAIDAVLIQRNEQIKIKQEKKLQQEKEEDAKLASALYPASKADEEWVDYVDSFGRSRRCLKKDLAELEKQKKQIYPKSKLDLMSADMQREMQRQQWEEEQHDALEQPVDTGPIHYANVQFNEIREHGVGYYQFAKEENAREQQMAALNSLREQTIVNRLKKEKLKEKRKAALKARLAKVKQRRLLQNGESAENAEQEVDDDSDRDSVEEEVFGPRLNEKDKEIKPLTRDESWRKDAPLREWDKEKEGAEKWLRDRQNERLEEFAPPQFYYEANESNKKTKFFAKDKLRNKAVSDANIGPRCSEKLRDNAEERVIGLATDAEDTTENKDTKAQSLDVQLGNDSAGSSKVLNFVTTDNNESNANITNYYANSYSFPPPCLPIPGVLYPFPPPPLYINPVQSIPNELSSDNLTASTYTSSNSSELLTTHQSTVTEALELPILCSDPQMSNESSGNNETKKQTAMAPQPAHYSAGPMKPQPKTIKYERINFASVPISLPVPPVASAPNNPLYPSQEDSQAWRKDKCSSQPNEQQMIKNWHKQFNDQTAYSQFSNTSKPRLPFPSPYVQKKDS